MALNGKNLVVAAATLSSSVAMWNTEHQKVDSIDLADTTEQVIDWTKSKLQDFHKECDWKNCVKTDSKNQLSELMANIPSNNYLPSEFPDLAWPIPEGLQKKTLLEECDADWNWKIKGKEVICKIKRKVRIKKEEIKQIEEDTLNMRKDIARDKQTIKQLDQKSQQLDQKLNKLNNEIKQINQDNRTLTKEIKQRIAEINKRKQFLNRKLNK